MVKLPFLRFWLALLVPCCIGFCPSEGMGAEPVGAPGKPNVLFLAIDDLNDWTGCLGGYPGIQTPNLDRILERGTLFTHAYCAAPACNPSRVALLTGLAPATTGVYHNSQPFRPVRPDAVTLPQLFRKNGYEVAGGGKIFHSAYPDKPSWDEYFKEGNDPLPRGGGGGDRFGWGPLDVGDGAMADAKTVSWAEEFLKRPRERPFFLAVGLHKPHLPWRVPRQYFDLHPLEMVTRPPTIADDLADVPESGRRIARPEGDHRWIIETQNWENAIQGYLACISFCDAQVGRLALALQNSPYAANTIIVVWSDHGWHLGEKEHWRKFALWEEATRVCLGISVPGGATGQRSRRAVNLLDLYPTLADLCHLSGRPADLEGTSLVPLLADPNATWDRPAVTTHGRGNHAVRSERWRYIRYADGAEELYDHEADPQEWNNRASDPATSAVKAELARWLPKSDAPDAPDRSERKR